MPLSGECLRCWLRRAVSTFGCDGSYRWMKEWSKRRGESWTRRKRWVRAYGAPCDCQALVHAYGETFCEQHALAVAATECPDCTTE